MADNTDTINGSFLEEMAAHKRSLQAAEQQMQLEYDKSVMTLSGGALGISLAFLKDIVSKEHVLHGECFVSAWVFWAVSIACVLASFFTSTKALRKAVESIDQQTIYLDYSKCLWTKATKGLNLASGTTFLLGVVGIVIFIWCNLPNNKRYEYSTQNASTGHSPTRRR